MSPTTSTPHRDSPEAKITHQRAAVPIGKARTALDRLQAQGIEVGLIRDALERIESERAALWRLARELRADNNVLQAVLASRSPEKTPERGGEAA
ncbi:hypothetical protein ACVWXO_008059 [Bradyrhizobium sp. LM2.7]